MPQKRLIAALLIVACWVSGSAAKVYPLKNGMQLVGQGGTIASMGEDVLAAGASGSSLKLIVVVDDGLRRTFVSKHQLNVAGIRNEVEAQERIRLRQNIATKGARIGRIGTPLGATELDDFGHRTFSMLSAKGRIDVVQGITDITPRWTRLQGLQSSQPYLLDMRIATSSIPRQTLRKILETHLDADNADARLSIVRLHLQSERYAMAETELREAIEDFPELAALKTQLKQLKQLRSEQTVDEIKMRKKAGQFQLVATLLRDFPVENVAGEILLQVSEIKEEMEAQVQSRTELIAEIEKLTEALDNGPRKAIFQEFVEQLKTDLGFDTLGRLADFERLRSDEELSDEQKLSLALSGWTLGGTGMENIAVAASTWRVRELVREYLSTTDPATRNAAFDAMQSEEAATPTYMARMIAALRPPKPTPEHQQQQEIPGWFRLETPALAQGLERSATIRYRVQLPPEYNPYRRYPTIVTLHGAQTTPTQQVEWWSGPYNAGLKMRMGQAARHGYIVIAPEWARPRQRAYEYTAQEHASVLFSLQDAMKRFSIDSDRVFLSGHYMGGTAAWDLGLAHPDLWAGVIPINGQADYGQADSPKYVAQYWENARHQVPFYFVNGALDSVHVEHNSRDLNRYLTKPNFDVVAVEFLGRGSEPFQDEVQRLFGWMKNAKRDPFPERLYGTSMRPWDNYFWWLELGKFANNVMILPQAWPARRGLRPTKNEAWVKEKRNVFVKTSAATARVWFTPELVDMDQKVTVHVNGTSHTPDISPKIRTMLDDARQRADRQHVFWSTAEFSTGRGR